jgi:DMSO/TMAO reductase YedYZ molybdopterin-dependent catalytic subunit
VRKRGVRDAVLSACLAAIPLIAVFFFGWRRLGLPFVPFDLFDMLSRLLPGSLITRSIEMMIGVIRALHLGPTAAVAKTAEQTMAVMLFFVTLAIAGTVYLLIARKSGSVSGLFLGIGIGILLTFPIGAGQTARVNHATGFLAVFILMILWGLLLSWLRNRIFAAPPVRNTQVTALDRRHVLIRLGEASALITVVGAVAGALSREKRPEKAADASNSVRWSENHSLPNAEASVRPAPGTRPEFTPLESHYRIDINTSPPRVKEDGWKLSITGLVGRPMSLTLSDIRKFDPKHQFVTLACISNLIAGDLIGTQRWTGVSMQRLLQEIQPLPNATHLKIKAADGFFEVVSLDTIRRDARVMLTYEWDGVPLPPEHGFPLRIYIPDRYGMKQPKWIQSMEFMDHPEEGYWVKRGWDAEARMRATSVIDTMSSNMMISEGKGGSVIPLGGIAHAGARGISRVQVQVDQEPWRDAQLRTPLSGTTWVIWRFDWPFMAGRHTFTVRCFEGGGAPQITAEAPPHPSGATGLHSTRAML